MRLISILLLACLCPFLEGGCLRVRPWERELLAKPKMEFDGDPEAALLEQPVDEYRQGQRGAHGAGGAGRGAGGGGRGGGGGRASVGRRRVPARVDGGVRRRGGRLRLQLIPAPSGSRGPSGVRLATGILLLSAFPGVGNADAPVS